MREGTRARHIQPAELCGIGNARISQLQRETRQISIDDLRTRGRKKAMLLVHVPQPVACTRCRTPGTPAPLVGRRTTHAYRVQAGEPSHRIVAWNTRPAGIHHHPDTFDREARFRHARTQHHLAAPRRGGCERCILLGEWHAAVQHVQVYVGRYAPHQPFRRATLLSHPRQEHQHVSLALGERIAHDATSGRLHALVAARRAMMRGDREHAATASHDRRRPRTISDQLRHGITVERGRHDQHAQVLAQLLLGFEHESETKVRMQRPLMELIEEHRAVAVERGVGREEARQHPLGHHFDTCLLAHPRFAAYAIAHGAAHLLAKGARHVLRSGAGSEAPRLEHHDLLRAQPRRRQQCEWHACGLAGAWRCLEHRHGARLQRRLQRRERLVDRQHPHHVTSGGRDVTAAAANHRAAARATAGHDRSLRRCHCGNCGGSCARRSAASCRCAATDCHRCGAVRPRARRA